MPNQFIQAYCRISQGLISVNGKSLDLSGTNTLAELLKAGYQSLGMDYPKFFKMDEMSKASVLATELLLKAYPFTEEQTGSTAVVFANASSTLETDKKHQQSIQDPENFFPSPAVFVYTLPNISIGEVTIRHKWKGENTFFITEDFDIPFMQRYASSMLTSGRAARVLTGWLEVGVNGYDILLYLVDSSFGPTSLEHTIENVHNLYKSGSSI